MSKLSSYRPHHAMIPTEQREKINRGILNLIRGGQNPDRAKVFSGYTGKGGLHGLKYSDFANRYEYTEAKRTIEQGQFFTPDAVVSMMAEFLSVPAGENVIDLTCGAGAFANHFRNQRFHGLEIDNDAVTVASYIFPEAKITEGDLRSWTPTEKFRFVVGNPPFGLRWAMPGCAVSSEAGEASSEDVFLWQARQALATGGTVCFVAPASYLNDDIVCAKALTFIESNFDRVAEVLLPSNAFAAVGVEEFATKIVLLRGWMPSESPHKTAPAIIDARTQDLQQALAAWRAACPSYMQFRAELGAKRAELAFADQREGRVIGATKKTFEYRYLRLLNELKRQNASQAVAIEEKWAEAHAPASFDRLGNRVSQITPEAVMRQLRRALRAIDIPERHLVRIVRTNRGYKAKAYSRTAALAIGDAQFDATLQDLATGEMHEDTLECSIELVKEAVLARNDRRRSKSTSTEVVEFEELNFRRSVRRKARRFQLWSRPLSVDFPELNDLREQVAAYYGSLAEHGVTIRDLQVDTVARHSAKPGCFTTWQMGVGKSLSALAWDQVKRNDDAKRGRSSGWTLVISSALAIELHWTDMLSEYELAFTRPESREEWHSIGNSNANGQRFILATHYQVGQYAKVIRGLVRQGLITALIVDESDEFGNNHSARTQAVQVAGREIRHKNLLTGTPGRNNAAEAFPQLSLLLHGEQFFRCVAKIQVVYSHEAGDFIHIKNPDYLKAYQGRGGLALFKRCHSPSRPSVMGVERTLPELPSSKELKEYMDCFRSRIRLSQLRKDAPFQRETVAVELGRSERMAYNQIAREAISMAKAHLSADRSERRATMLSLAHAIRILQQATSMPEKFGFSGVGAKQEALVEAVRDSSATHVAVGVIWRESIERLLPVFQREFSDRTIVSFTGEESFAKRKRLLATLNAAPRGLLLCTQQSVRSSLNLPIVSEVIAESFPWNFTSLNQWAMRFCRLTSATTVKVKLLTAVDTIEERILGLLMRKEKAVSPLAGDTIESDEDLISEYGIPADDLDELARYLAEYDPAIRKQSEAMAA